MKYPVDLKFVRMLSSESAAAATLHRIGLLGSVHAGIDHWSVQMEPPAAAQGAASYAVRVQAQLKDGAVLAIRAHDADLVTAVHSAFTGMEQAISVW
jgi:hypothetical protein